MIDFFSQLWDLISFTQLKKSKKSIVFYSEGRDSWTHLRGLIEEFLKINEVDVCYISSEEDDPGLNLKNPNYRAFCMGSGHILNWLFLNIETNIMVMTMPDLNSFQLKQSKHNVHYVYVQHSLVSLHMAYRKGAFDNFNTIFCGGPHHIKEVRATEKKYNLHAKNLVKHGYSRLDSLIKVAQKNADSRTKEKTYILIAPSWGENGLIETLGKELVGNLLSAGYKVTLRPHPQTIKLSKVKVDEIRNLYGANESFNLETELAIEESLCSSDLMITDWSGASMDYSFGLKKAVLFLDLPKKINNPEYNEINIEPIEVTIRSKIGSVVSIDNFVDIHKAINKLLKDKNSNLEELRDENVFNIHKSDLVGAKELKKLFGKFQ